MRIMMITYGYPPVIGGAEQYIRNLSAELVTRGHAVSVVTLWHEGLLEFETDQGVHVYRIRGTVHRIAKLIFKEPGRVYAPPFSDPEMMMAIWNIVKRERPEIVHAHNWLLHSFLPLKSASKVKLVETLHSYGLVCAKWNLLYKEDGICSGPELLKCLDCAKDQYGSKTLITVVGRRLTQRKERNKIDKFLPVSPAVAEGNALSNGHFPVEVLPNFIPDDVATRRNDSAACLKDLPNGDFILFVGALTAKKGIYVLLEAYTKLDNPPPLVLIGSTWRDTPRNFPHNVTVLRNWPHDAVMSAWNRCIIGVTPSLWPEPSPTVVLEAMAMGHPVIGSRIGGIPEQIVDGETGYLVTPGDSEELRQALERLLTDHESRERMGLAAKEQVKKFFASTIVARVEEIYDEVLST
jgi:glycosyltransferase involved in cell wall biosynthesis